MNNVTIDLAALSSPAVFRGDAVTSYRDPAAVWHEEWFHLYFTLVKIEAKHPRCYLAHSKSRDLRSWTLPAILSPRESSRNYSNPGSMAFMGPVKFLYYQSSPLSEDAGSESARLCNSIAFNLDIWSLPNPFGVPAPNDAGESTSSVTDPFIFADKDQPGKWWCFYRSNNSLCLSWSNDLSNWQFDSTIDAGDNPCVIIDNNEYVLFHSTQAGIGMTRSANLKTWRDEGVLNIDLSLSKTPWSACKPAGASVLDLRNDPAVGKALLFFHASDSPANETSLLLAISDDLKTWILPRA